MTSKTLLRKPKADLIKILEEQSQIVNNQSKIIESLQITRINLDKEVRDRYTQETHLTKVFNNLKVSQERINMTLGVLYPLSQMEVSTPQLVEKDVMTLANTVLGNELKKITLQQVTELKQPLKIK